jgi:hypothetical protein
MKKKEIQEASGSLSDTMLVSTSKTPDFSSLF